MVGAAAASQQPHQIAIHATENLLLPIQTGFGEMPPVALGFCPVVLRSELLGVMALAAAIPLQARDLAFLENRSAHLGAALYNIKQLEDMKMLASELRVRNNEICNVMKTHCTVGAQILKKGTSPYVEMGAEIALSHHERWDGSGYPNGHSGENIPLSARIVSICDQYDALRSKRPYKEALSHDNAVHIITQGDGRTLPRHFDPQVLDTFKKNSDQFTDIYSANLG